MIDILDSFSYCHLRFVGSLFQALPQFSRISLKEVLPNFIEESKGLSIHHPAFSSVMACDDGSGHAIGRIVSVERLQPRSSQAVV
jgi:hypothetical protein